MRTRQFILVTVVAMWVMAVPYAAAQYPPRRDPPRTASPPKSVSADDKLAAAVRGATTEALDQLQINGNYEAAQTSLQAAFDQVLAFDPCSDKTLWCDVAFSRRLVNQVKDAHPSIRADVLRYLLKNPQLARSLAFVMPPDEKETNEAFSVLNQLRAAHANQLDQYANLAAAICVVHDQPLVRRINENEAKAPDPVALFEYFVANEKKMAFGLQNVPAELLIYVVDSTTSIDEMNWALEHYAGDQNVGERFFDIKYDYDHLQDGDTKRVTAAGLSLPNILKFGGVCADQAYYAVSIGKAIGVPTAYTRGASGETSHAWVGFLQTDGRRAWWNFDSGRYEVYQGVRGMLQNPQTRRDIPDSYASLLAEFISAKPLNRQAAAAITDGARRLIDLQVSKLLLDAPRIPNSDLSAVRTANTADTLSLLQIALESCPGFADGWLTVRQMAKDGQLTLADKKKWESVLYRLCGERYPDFYLAVLDPMIESVEDVKDENALWNAAFSKFTRRADLAAFVRMRQAAMWTKQNEFARAGQCYEDVIARYANAGPFVLDALYRAEKLLRDNGDGARVLSLYESAWSRVKKPEAKAAMFFNQSNYYRVGDLYAKRLDEAGQTSAAAKVRAAIQTQ